MTGGSPFRVECTLCHCHSLSKPSILSVTNANTCAHTLSPSLLKFNREIHLCIHIQTMSRQEESAPDIRQRTDSRRQSRPLLLLPFLLLRAVYVGDDFTTPLDAFQELSKGPTCVWHTIPELCNDGVVDAVHLVVRFWVAGG